MSITLGLVIYLDERPEGSKFQKSSNSNRALSQLIKKKSLTWSDIQGNPNYFFYLKLKGREKKNWIKFYSFFPE